jgi:hypothetical protein
MIKTSLAFLTLLAALLATGAAQAACIYPRAPDNIPDGRTATMDQMVAAQKAVKQFDACLTMELEALMADPGLDEARKAELAEMQVKKNNAAVDEAQAVADRFNEQVRAFKEANPK